MHLQSLHFFSFPLPFLGLGHHVLILNFCSNHLTGFPASRLALIQSHCHTTVHSKKFGLTERDLTFVWAPGVTSKLAEILEISALRGVPLLFKVGPALMLMRWFALGLAMQKDQHDMNDCVWGFGPHGTSPTTRPGRVPGDEFNRVGNY